MKRSTQLIHFLVVLLGIFAATFLLLDIRLVQAEMATDSETETVTFNVSGNGRQFPLGQDLYLYVQAPPRLEEAFVAAVREELRRNPYVRDIHLQEEPLVAAENSVLVVEIDEASVLFWSPFCTRSVVTVNVAYASDGEVDWIDEKTIVLETTEAPSVPVVRVQMTHQSIGNAYGLISRPGYASYLADAVAERTSQSLEDTLSNAGS